MRMREAFYTGVALIIAGAFIRNGYYGGWVMGIGGLIIVGLGFWKLIRFMEGTDR